MPSGDAGVGLVEISATDIEPIVAAFDEYESVFSVTVLEAQADRSLVQFETTEPLLLRTLSEAGIPLELPITIADGEVTAPRERLSELGTLLEQFGVPFDLVSVTQSVDTQSLLTAEQYELLETAIERGYYDTPRTSTLTELADAVGLAKSTTSEKLHRAEGKVIKEFVGTEDASLR
jgi:predicted DNA binding protein